MGIFYPDNDKRQSRVIELYSDCQSIINQLASTQQGIVSTLQSINASYAAIYKGAGNQTLPTVGKIDVGNGVTVDVIQGVSPFVVLPVVQSALTKASTSYLLSQGRIGEAALADLVGLPTWFRVGIGAGGILAVIGVSLVVDAVNGAIEKNKLIDAIHALVPPRLNLETALLTANQLNTSLGNVASVITALQAAGQPVTTVQSAVEGLYQQYQQKISSIGPNVAQAVLNQLDQSRQSFTDDDTGNS